MTPEARKRAGDLLRDVQEGILPAMPHSRPMPGIAPHCHELRIPDRAIHTDWRIIYAITDDEILVLDVFAKKTQKTPDAVLTACRKRLSDYLG